jgi:DNA-binding beta-propeller fold protein YncE
MLHRPRGGAKTAGMILSRLSALLLALALCAGGRAQAAIAIVANSADASISVIDMDKRVELRRVPVLREPHHVALSPDGHDLLMGDSGGNEMLFIDPRTGEVRRRVPVTDPYHIGFSPNGKLLTVTGLARNQVDIYDAATMTLIKRFPTPTMPSHLAYAPDGSMVYITLQGTDKLAAFDLKRMQPSWVSPVGKTPAGVVWYDGKLLVANMGTDYVAVVDPADGQVLRKIHTGRGAHQVFIAPDGKQLWVNNRVEGTTVALDPKTLDVVRSFKISGGPDCIDFAPDGKLWITQRWAQKVAVLDPRTGDIQSIAVGRSPHGIFLSTDLQAAK